MNPIVSSNRFLSIFWQSKYFVYIFYRVTTAYSILVIVQRSQLQFHPIYFYLITCWFHMITTFNHIRASLGCINTYCARICIITEKKWTTFNWAMELSMQNVAANIVATNKLLTNRTELLNGCAIPEHSLVQSMVAVISCA